MQQAHNYRKQPALDEPLTEIPRYVGRRLGNPPVELGRNPSELPRLVLPRRRRSARFFHRGVVQHPSHS